MHPNPPCARSGSPSDPAELWGKPVPAQLPQPRGWKCSHFTVAPAASLHLLTQVCLAGVGRAEGRRVLGLQHCSSQRGKGGKLTSSHCSLLQKVRAPLLCDLQGRITGSQLRGSGRNYPSNVTEFSCSFLSKRFVRQKQDFASVHDVLVQSSPTTPAKRLG